MAGSFRGPSIHSGFEDVLQHVGRDFAPGLDEDVAEDGPGPNPSSHASFEFLRALDTVADRQWARPEPAGGLAGSYAETEFEPEYEAPFQVAPFEARDAAAEAPSATEAAHDERREAQARIATVSEASDPVSLAAELGLRAGMPRAELRRLRRDFALKNHPDRVGPLRSETASRRMTIANALIDAALRQAT
jgi:hypothetical protein